MAGDWMKIELELPDKPEVHSIAGTLNLDPDCVVGKLVRVWQWFDKHTTDGNAHGVTYSLLDRITGVTGFGEAMMFVGWMEQNDKILTMPKFDRHTSASAKQRALTAKRVEKVRAKNVTVEALPREEKRREDNINTPPLKMDTKKRKPTKTTISDSFTISEAVKSWADANGHSRLQERLSHFVNTAKAKGYEYADWDAAFRNAISDDWAKLGKCTASKSFDMDEFLRSK